MAGCLARFQKFTIPVFAAAVKRSPSLTFPAIVHAKPRRVCPSYLRFSSSVPKHKKETVTVYFVDRDGTKLPAKAKVGDNLLDIVIDNDIDIDGYGVCEGTLACSTCHLIFKQEDYDKIQDKPTDEELDMLDLAYGLSDTSRLGCQVAMTKEMDGLEVQIPSGVADARDPS